MGFIFVHLFEVLHGIFNRLCYAPHCILALVPLSLLKGGQGKSPGFLDFVSVIGTH